MSKKTKSKGCLTREERIDRNLSTAPFLVEIAPGREIVGHLTRRGGVRILSVIFTGEVFEETLKALRFWSLKRVAQSFSVTPHIYDGIPVSVVTIRLNGLCLPFRPLES